jgi:hypothetical protein
MMDARPIYYKSFHSIKTDRTPDLKHHAPYMTRTDRPTKYYFVNFRNARKYERQTDETVMDPMFIGDDQTVPEHQSGASQSPVDPFAVDAYCLGSLVRTEFLQVIFTISSYPQDGANAML